VGQLVLDHLGIDRFVKVDDHIYDEARALVRQIEDIAWTP
jgi:hypothetical protein